MNVLVIDVDSLRPDHVGAYGYDPPTTPNVDALAADGVRFERAYAANSPCMPSRAALTTGRYGVSNGVVTHGAGGRVLNGPHNWRDRGGERREWARLPELFFRERVRTVAVSSFPRHPATWFYHLWDEFHQPREPPGDPETFQTPRAGAVADRAIDALDRTDDGDDCFLYVQFWDPHTPYKRPEGEVERFADAPLPPFQTDDRIDDHRSWNRWHSADRQGIADREDLRRTLAAYDAEIRHADGAIGRLLDALRDAGRYGETLIVLVADHGEEFGEHGVYRDHANVYEPTQRIPLVIKPPADAPRAGAPREELVTNVDLAPTIADYADLDAPKRWQGRSIRPLVGGDRPAPDWRNAVVLEHGLYTAQRAIRTDRWKFVRTYHSGPWPDEIPSRALYDLDADPREQANVANDEPETVDRLEREMTHWVERRGTLDADPLKAVARRGPAGLRYARD